ncbi:unnamed protein product, partial [marine sediment metagenome]
TYKKPGNATVQSYLGVYTEKIGNMLVKANIALSKAKTAEDADGKLLIPSGDEPFITIDGEDFTESDFTKLAKANREYLHSYIPLIGKYLRVGPPTGKNKERLSRSYKPFVATPQIVELLRLPFFQS